ncbi:hypothetical protein PGRAT_09095 [Paenibacillus graminis]|uniref:Uncharacterized protein n=1 Tax=Paenibacillus graminis TaxID=189425 RepID=A0A089M5Y1_9BACL|nr:hypothetical protein PGRAT_09095 [Paenibacillus graminis]
MKQIHSLAPQGIEPSQIHWISFEFVLVAVKHQIRTLPCKQLLIPYAGNQLSLKELNRLAMKRFPSAAKMVAITLLMQRSTGSLTSVLILNNIIIVAI